LQAQEYISGLSTNPVLKEHLIKKQEQAHHKASEAVLQVLSLPFYDDFSDISVYPNPAIWYDDEAYINSDYGVLPINYGVATLDAIDANGDVYPEGGPFPFIADRLTSHLIRLDSIVDQNYEITPADSVYFSFYYQPQGRGITPAKYDSLVLEFGYLVEDTIFSHYDSILVYGSDYMDPGDSIVEGSVLEPPGEICDINLLFILEDDFFFEDSLMIPCSEVYMKDTEWTSIWRAEGDTLSVFKEENNAYFKQVMIPITDTMWFRSDFRFRFKNYASLSSINSWQSNTDHWHIDMVELDINRSINDTTKKEIGFSEKPTSFLKDYYSMPFNQYYEGVPQEKNRDTIDIYIHNLDSIPHNVHYEFTVKHEDGSLMTTLNESVEGSLIPQRSIDVFDNPPFARPRANLGNFEPTSLADSNRYIITHFVYDTETETLGDTLEFYQDFYNYFSHDDGTAEVGYGLTPAGSMLACQYEIVEIDTLRGVQMYFNRTLSNSNYRLMDIAVWNDNNGIPGYLIKQIENIYPEFTDGINNIHTYIFPEGIELGIGKFYVGWIQSTNDNLNVGFDRNTNSQDQLFYNVNGSWVSSSFEGSVMIRPIIGESLVAKNPEEKSAPAELEIFPNPTVGNNAINIVLPSSVTDPTLRKYLELRIFDLCGRQIYRAPYSETLNVSFLKKGIYIVDIFDSAFTRHYTTKLMITK
jgi:hypothetical protein